MLIVPYTETLTIEYENLNGKWNKNYALNSFEYAIVVVPIILLLVLVPTMKRGVIKKVSIVILCLLAGFAFLFAFQSLSLSIQDFVPNDGMLVLIFLFPIVLIDSFIEWKRNKTIHY